MLHFDLRKSCDLSDLHLNACKRGQTFFGRSQARDKNRELVFSSAKALLKSFHWSLIGPQKSTRTRVKRHDTGTSEAPLRGAMAK